MTESLGAEIYLEMDDNKKMVIIGGFGWEDIGDEAMPQTVIYNLKNRIPYLNIVMLSPNPSYTSAYHQQRSISDVNGYLQKQSSFYAFLRRLGFFGKILCRLYPNTLEYIFRWVYFFIVAKCRARGVNLPIDKTAMLIINELSSSQLLFNNGGGNINTLLHGELYKQTLTILAASAMRVPVILSGQTIGPITRKLDAWVTRWALNSAQLITLRDSNISAQRLKNIGVSKPLVVDTADDAIGLPMLSKQETIELIIENGGEHWLNLESDIVAVMNMNGYFKAMGKTSIHEMHKEICLLANLGDMLVQSFNAKILLVPTDVNRSSDDRPLLLHLKHAMQFNERAFVVMKEYEAIRCKSLIGLGDCAIGVRYHFVVFATSAGVPCIGLANGLYQKTKLRGVLGLYDLEEFFICEDMDKVQLSVLQQATKRLVLNRHEISSHLKERTVQLEQNSLLSIWHAVTILSDEMKFRPLEQLNS